MYEYKKLQTKSRPRINKKTHSFKCKSKKSLDILSLQKHKTYNQRKIQISLSQIEKIRFSAFSLLPSTQLFQDLWEYMRNH